jgi:hypothetical protein
MLVTCPGCEEKVKVKDSAAGTKIRCPECGGTIKVPAAKNETSVASKPAKKPRPVDDDEESPPVKKSRKPADDEGDEKPKKKSRKADPDDEEDTEEKPKKKSNTGMILGIVGGGLLLVLLLCVGVPIGGWFLFMRSDDLPKNGIPIVKNDRPPEKKDKGGPAPVEITFGMSGVKVERHGAQIDVALDFNASNPRDDEVLGVYAHFPGDPAEPKLIKLANAKELRDQPKGRWTSARIMPSIPAQSDTTLEVVAYVATDRTKLPGGGRMVAKVANLPIPPRTDIPVTPASVNLSNVVAKQNAADNLLQDTLVVWMGEVGRTPYINNRAGRDHYIRAWTIVLAGGGIRGGQVYGASDQNGIDVRDDPVSEGDLFATIYTALGIDPRVRHYVGTRPIWATPEGSRPIRALLG